MVPDDPHPVRFAGSAKRDRSTPFPRSSSVALPSTAAAGTRSRITATLAPGAGVVTTRAHVRTIVTEWGVAELFGRSVAERAAALIGIAHPDFRDQLRAEARATLER